MKIGDLFCGAGIGAIGSHELGLETVYAYDNNKYAVQTYNENFNTDIAKCVDVKKLDIQKDFEYCDIVMAGFPCKSFSVNGKNQGKDDKKTGSLSKLTVDVINETKPKSFFLENVAGLVSKTHIEYFNELIEKLSKYYNVKYKLMNFADYGLPQKRVRIIIVGIRKDLENSDSFEFPETTHENNYITIRDTISDLKELGVYIPNHNIDIGIRKDELPFVEKIKCGENWKALPVEDQKTFMKKAFYSSGGRTSFLRKVDLDKPAFTILSSPKGKSSSQILDWGNGSRRYTVRESLRLQGVPDWFKFSDNVPLNKQYERCSGIPPMISKMIIEKIIKIIK